MGLTTAQEELMAGHRDQVEELDSSGVSDQSKLGLIRRHHLDSKRNKACIETADTCYFLIGSTDELEVGIVEHRDDEHVPPIFDKVSHTPALEVFLREYIEKVRPWSTARLLNKEEQTLIISYSDLTCSCQESILAACFYPWHVYVR